MSDLTTKRQLQAIFPEVIGAVITFDNAKNKVNLCPVNFQAVSTEHEAPLCVCIGLSNEGYTLQNILSSKQFVYAYPSSPQLKDILYCGTVSGRSADKLKRTRLEFTKSNTVSPPNLKSAVTNFECKLKHHYAAGNFTVVIGEISQINGGEKLQKIYSLGRMKYGTISPGEVIQEGR